VVARKKDTIEDYLFFLQFYNALSSGLYLIDLPISQQFYRLSDGVITKTL
jgi:hypothetical protein